MVWNSRYPGTERGKLATLPLMPGGKLALGSLWKASATLINLGYYVGFMIRSLHDDGDNDVYCYII